MYCLVQIRVHILGIELWITKHSNDPLQLNVSPSVQPNVYHGIYMYIILYTCIKLHITQCTCILAMYLIYQNILVYTSMKLGLCGICIYQYIQFKTLYILVYHSIYYFLPFHTMLLFMVVCKFCDLSIRGTSRYILELCAKSCYERFHRVSSMVSAF